MLYLSTSASHSHGNGNSPIPLHNHHTPVSVQAHIITTCCFRAIIIIIIIMFYCAIIAARLPKHTVQYTHTVIHANTSTKKTQKDNINNSKTVKRNRTGKTRATLGLAEWLACWTQAQKGLDSNRSRDAVGLRLGS